ncbi:predicted protein [Paecilomyces variotii No. 5]|uniref:Uncharacterized protein n=1 Tax=Byssochlamys spectabilis (strain No. 5 / NBRC 109023) TaxID=1356009 RepID=V5F993_BYSSN|nr:predicted protein [Paecilomyces variotii No. 5]
MTTDLVRDYLVLPIYRHHYIGFESFRDFLLGSLDSIRDNSVFYLAVLDFNSDDLVQLERRGLRNRLPKFTVLIDNNTGTMIIKLMPGVAQNRVSRLMNGFLRDRLVLLSLQRLLLPAGSARMRFPTGLEKEPDEQLMPRTRNALTDYPSFVLEVGVSETLSQLRRDARLWLTNTNGRTRLVLIVALNKTRKLMRFERWENSPNVVTRSTRSSTPTGT